MPDLKNCLCRDINGNVRIVKKSALVKRSSVYGVIKNDQGVLLVLNRISDGKWDLPGGGIEYGEDLIVALHREIKEETGLQVVGEPKKICEFNEYFYDVDSKKGWESSRYFFEIGTEGTLLEGGNNDDIIETRFFSMPLSPTEVAPVGREIIAMSFRKTYM